MRCMSIRVEGVGCAWKNDVWESEEVFKLVYGRLMFIKGGRGGKCAIGTLVGSCV